MANLDEEDMVFVKKFILSSGSLKDMAKEYQVTYPTVEVTIRQINTKNQP